MFEFIEFGGVWRLAVMWGEILGGATVFGAIMAIAAFINGRSTKRFVAKLVKEMAVELGSKMDEGFRRMDEGFRRMDEGFKLIARLIVEENDRARKDILEALKK